MDAVVAAAKIGFGITPLVLGCAGIPPSHNGVVVVRARVHDLPVGTMRQVHVRALIPKSELQDGHTGDVAGAREVRAPVE